MGRGSRGRPPERSALAEGLGEIQGVLVAPAIRMVLVGQITVGDGFTGFDPGFADLPLL